MQQLTNGKRVFYVLAVVLAAFLLRIFMLGSQSLWLDEAEIYSLTKATSAAEVYSKVMEEEGHIGPLYHILNYLSSQVFGYSEWALRLPSAVYGTISVLLIYMVASSLWNDKVALLSSLLLALSPLHVWYSQEARMYSLWLMLTLMTMMLFIKTSDKKSPYLWLLLTLCISLSFWTFLNSLFVCLGLGLHLLISARKNKLRWHGYALSVFVGAATYLPGVLALLKKEAIAVGGTRQTSVVDLAYAFYAFNVGTSFGPTLYAIRASLNQFGAITVAFRILSHNFFTVVAPMLFFGGLFAFGILKAIRERKNDSYRFILLLLLVPSAFIFAIARFSPSLAFNIRYILCALPCYLILLSVTLCHTTPRKRYILISLTCLVYLLSLYNHYFEAEYAKLDFRSVVKYLHENMRNDDKAIILHEWASSILSYYDKTGTVSDYWIPQTDSLPRASSIMNHSKRLFYVKSVVIQQYDEGLIATIEKSLFEDFGLVGSTNHVPHIRIEIYERRTPYPEETGVANQQVDHTSLLEGYELAAGEIERHAH